MAERMHPDLLKNSQELLSRNPQEILNRFAFSTAILSADGHLISVNDRFLNLTNRPENAIIGSHFNMIEPVSTTLTLEEVWSQLNNDRVIENWEFALHPTDGNDGPVRRVVCSMRPDVIQGVRFTFVSLVDMTDLLTRQKIDPLTKLFIRGYLNDIPTNIIQKADKNDLPVSILMLDIDGFKDFNNTHGHIVGDQILAEIAALIQTSIRSRDIAVRYGGEEITVVLPDMQISEAEPIAERIRSNVATKAFQTNVGPLHLTISIGVGSNQSIFHIDQPTDIPDILNVTLQKMIFQADQALLKAKQAGRNQVKTPFIV